MRRILLLVSLFSLTVAGVIAQQRDAGDTLARIRTEGLQRSGALTLYRTLTDDIGARLTGSPSHVRAARWARDRFAEWGLADPHLEPYDFGRGWQVDKLSVEMTEPRYMPLIAYPDAWSPGTKGVVTGRVVYVGDKTTAQVQAMGAQLRGAIVLTHLPVTEWVTRDRPQPGLDDRPVATGNPALPQPKSTSPANSTTSSRGSRPPAVRRRCACSSASASSPTIRTATTSSRRFPGRTPRCAVRSSSSAAISTRGTRRAARPTTPTARSR
ncbi:MAG TPA: hypothetical protein VN628_07405 [Vicinamibacterales bacterium]|nr:hypothetical protein [Vicinamibacterales bacterium]